MGQGKERAKADPLSIDYDESAGRTHTLKVLGNFLLATYSPGYNTADRETLQKVRGGEEYQAFKQKIEGKYHPRLLVMDHQGNALQHLDIPQTLNHRQFLVRDGELWWLSRMNMNEEEDFVKVYRVEIKEDKKD
ncbi:MAG: hypothetical protein WD426_05920 [Anditalea sp.]